MRRDRILCLLLALTLTLSGCAAAAAATAAQEEKNCQLYYLVRDLDRAAGGDKAVGRDFCPLRREAGKRQRRVLRDGRHLWS